jgi:hypothetical protein
MLRTLVLLVGSLVALSAANSPAQDVVLGQLYGNGVHAYFAGDFVKAHDQLTAAVTGGSHDPRVYYYRGLAYVKLGRDQEAVQDFKRGAELESKDFNRSFNVARSLERVQGAARQQLETYRVDARLAALEEANKVRKMRFESIKREEERVLSKQASQAPAEPVATPTGEPGAKAADDPFGNPATEKKAVAEGEVKATEDKAVEDKPADENVTEDKAAEPKAAAPVAEKPEDGGAFGGGDMAEKPVEKAKDNPFQDEPAASETKAAPPVEKTATDKPAGENKAAAPVKQSILGALLKGGASGIKKSIGGSVSGLGGMMPGKGMPGGMVPGGNSVPAAMPAGGDPFGGGAEEKAAPPKQPAAEVPAGSDPFGTETEEKAAPPKKEEADRPADKKPADDPFAAGAEEKKADAPEAAAPKAEEAAPPKTPDAEKPAADADPFG